MADNRKSRFGAALRRALAPEGRLSLAFGLLLLAAILVMLNYLAARHYTRGDLTPSGIYSLSDKARSVLRALDRPLRITVFMVPPDRYRESLYHEVRELCDRFAAASSRVAVEMIDVDADAARAALLAKRYGITRDDLRRGVVVFSSGTRSRHVRARELAQYRQGKLAAFRGEAAMISALLQVTAAEQRRVCFSTGHGEADATSFDAAGYGLLAREVKRAGYRVRALSPRELAAAASGCNVVAIGGPQRRLAQLELEGLARYLRRGGRLLVLIGPVLDRGVTRYKKTGLEDSLRRWGVGLPENIVVDPLSIPGERPLLTWGTRAGYNKEHALSRLLAGKLTIWRLAREVRPLSRARALRAGCRVCVDARAYHSRWLVRSSAGGWAESDLVSLRGGRRLRFDAAVDTRGPVPVAVAARVGSTRLVVIGSERAVLNKRLTDADYSRDLVVNSVEWLAGAEARVAIGPRKPVHVRLSLDARQVSRVFLLSVVLLPALALAGALLTWWRRRK